MYYNLIASAEESTVLEQYVREERAPYGSYQSEAALERALIRLLEEEGYAYLPIHDEAELIANLPRSSRHSTTMISRMRSGSAFSRPQSHPRVTGLRRRRAASRRTISRI